jgi:hypothetical protein
LALPERKPGLVVRYDYLWADDAKRGRDQGKDRPACLVAASDPQTSPRFVVLLPITHSSPLGRTVGLPIPPNAARAIGLNDEPAWVIVSEHNVDAWPNSGLQPLPGQPGIFAYGFIPPALFSQIRTRFLELARAGDASSVRR